MAFDILIIATITSKNRTNIENDNTIIAMIVGSKLVDVDLIEANISFIL
jgi:hypothetical protein